MTRRRVKKTMAGQAGAAHRQALERERCGLCRKSKKPLTRTECCGRLICDDEASYVMFSFAYNSCSRNHRRYTLCGYHQAERHAGEWKSCAKCRQAFEVEIYVYYGTNEYNFEKLENPPAFEPTHCVICGGVIALGTDGYQVGREVYRCETCYED